MALADQIVQSNHAVHTISSSAYTFRGTPNIILIGVPDKAALNRVEIKLAANAIPHCAWHEPDFDNALGFTAIATIALTAEQKKPLAKYRLWQPSTTCACNSVKEWPAAHKAAGRSMVQVHPGAPDSMSARNSIGSSSRF